MQLCEEFRASESRPVDDDQPLFAGIAAWPDVGELVVAKGLQGIGEVDCGEFRRGAGCFTEQELFELDSRVADAVFGEIIREHCGFRWRDSRGDMWAAAFPGDVAHNGAQVAYAVAWKGLIQPLDPRVRRPLIHRAEGWLSQFFDSGIEPFSDRLDNARRLERQCRIAQQIDRGLRCLPLIAVAAQDFFDEVMVEVNDTVLWGPGDRPDDWHVQLECGLTSLTSLAIQKLQWECPYSSPTTVCKGPAIAYVKRGMYAWHFRVHDMLPDCLTAFRIACIQED